MSKCRGRRQPRLLRKVLRHGMCKGGQQEIKHKRVPGQRKEVSSKEALQGLSVCLLQC